VPNHPALVEPIPKNGFVLLFNYIQGHQAVIRTQPGLLNSEFAFCQGEK